MLGGVLWAVWSLLFRVSFEAAGGPFAHGLLLLAALLTLAGLVGLHALQGGNYGRIGRAGFYTAAVALLAQALAALVLLIGSEALLWLVAPGRELGPNGGVGALRGRHLAGDGAAALVWVGTHCGAADSFLPK
jgi:hypothetical protein